MKPLCTKCYSDNLTSEISSGYAGYRCGCCNQWSYKREADNCHKPFKPNCIKCGSNNLDEQDRKNYEGNTIEEYKCKDCGYVEKRDLTIILNHNLYDIARGNKCLILDDGKQSRGVEGTVMHVLRDGMIVVRFTPWGYTDKEWEATLVFEKVKGYDIYEALNPMPISKMHEGKFMDSEYCKLIKWWRDNGNQC